MLSEEIDTLLSECPDEYQRKMESLDSEELENYRIRLEGAAGIATDNCNSSIEQIKSKSFYEKFEQHEVVRKDLLQFFVMWTQDQSRPKSAGELARHLEGVITDFETNTDSNFTDFLDSYFSRDDRDAVIHSLILVAILNGDEEND